MESLSTPSSGLIRNVRLIEPGKHVRSGALCFHQGRIVSLDEATPDWLAGVPEVDGAGRLLSPGLIDVHTHGILNFRYETGPEAFRNAAKSLARFGVTTVTPTLVVPDLTSPALQERWMEQLQAIVESLPAITEVGIPGLHLEGPFLAIAGASCATMEGDLDLLERILATCGSHLASMSISPENRRIEAVIRRLRAQDVVVFITHTRASVEQTLAAIEAGATHATHFYNVFYAPPEADPGVRPVGAVEAILADPRVSVDFIADGVHVHPVAIRAAVAAKTWAGVTLITDANLGAGLPPGIHETPWGYSVRVSPERGARHLTKDTLAGSALTMNRGMANLLQWLPLPPEQVWAMGTLNPARLLGLENKGRLEPGAAADLVLWNNDLTPAQTWVGGRSIYEKTP